ncbi:MAG: DNA-3-methyladenine glycosylase [Cyanobacteria bacterium HKST-UBA06]|nr:DNA-3-methyladenine glycosylase [Cyanobacteria bacterium HKST-UBA05]MCA9807756.1 DNA-3-methyladenine glycosylase [Cyanobacteria bacterium HKST-UBA06]
MPRSGPPVSKKALKPLPKGFFKQDTLAVARQLLGQWLVVPNADQGQPGIFQVVETEAYTQDDPSCHAFNGPKGRGAFLYESPGLAYVYLIYGMYHCLNVVTEPHGRGGAVLFRALAPIWYPGLAVEALTPKTAPTALRTHGPGRLCKALGITKAGHHGIDLTSSKAPMFLAQSSTGSVPDGQIVTTTRIGISKAQDWPWRFYVHQNPWVSVP